MTNKNKNKLDYNVCAPLCSGSAVCVAGVDVNIGYGRRNYIKNIELNFDFPNYLQTSKNMIKDDGIGVIDLETLNYNDEGDQVVYSGGWAVKNYRYINYLEDNKLSIYIKDENDKCESVEVQLNCGNEDSIYGDDSTMNYKLASYNLIKNLIDSIFDSDYCNYTFYVHNLGRFDSIFLIKELSNLDYVIYPIWKDNAILKIKVYEPKTDYYFITFSAFARRPLFLPLL